MSATPAYRHDEQLPGEVDEDFFAAAIPFALGMLAAAAAAWASGAADVHDLMVAAGWFAAAIGALYLLGFAAVGLGLLFAMHVIDRERRDRKAASRRRKRRAGREASCRPS